MRHRIGWDFTNLDGILESSPVMLSVSPGLVALNVALDELGNGEEGANNDGPHVQRYRGGKAAPDDGGSWCADFVFFCCAEAYKRLGVKTPFKRSRGAKKLFRHISLAGSVVDPPQPGDVVLFERGKPGDWRGHIAICERVVSDKEIVTIEGNVGRYPAVVKRVDRRTDDPAVLGFCRLPISGEALL